MDTDYSITLDTHSSPSLPTPRKDPNSPHPKQFQSCNLHGLPDSTRTLLPYLSAARHGTRTKVQTPKKFLPLHPYLLPPPPLTEIPDHNPRRVPSWINSTVSSFSTKNHRYTVSACNNHLHPGSRNTTSYPFYTLA